MSKIQKPRGTQDIFFKSLEKFDLIVDTSSYLASKHNFYSIKIPTFEDSNLFERNLGEGSDAISKELYKFTDKGLRVQALRPELTAGTVRAYIENTELNSISVPLRLFSYGQVFRYDRPKRGRYREFNQINFELFNDESDISAVGVALELLKELKVLDKTLLTINFLGDAKDPYTESVRQYFQTHINQLSETSQTRLEKNPLRILDSKEPEDISLLLNCPKISEYYSEKDKISLKKITDFLIENQINFEIDNSLVRGLDYYTGLVFEFVAPLAEDGSNLAVLGGGRYDDLISQMGGKKTSAIGFGGGIERLMLLLDEASSTKKIYIVNITNKDLFSLINNLSREYNNASFQEIKIEQNKIGKTLQKLSKIENSFSIIVGEKELTEKKSTMKNLTTLEISTIILI